MLPANTTYQHESKLPYGSGDILSAKSGGDFSAQHHPCMYNVHYLLRIVTDFMHELAGNGRRQLIIDDHLSIASAVSV